MKLNLISGGISVKNYVFNVETAKGDRGFRLYGEKIPILGVKAMPATKNTGLRSNR